MTFDYLLRLILLCLASFYILHLVLGLAVRCATPSILRAASRSLPRTASDMLLAVRLAPSAIALSCVLALGLPSYLRFEPAHTTEKTGLLLWLLAALSVSVSMQSLLRAIRAVRASRAEVGPVLRLTGILRPRVVVSEGVRAALSEEQWLTVLRHEHAHLLSGDNAKRLLMILAPGLAPFYRGWQSIEQAWAEATERAADAAAVDGDPARALVLAEALVRVARLGLDRDTVELASPFVTNPESLRARVQSLIDGTPNATRGSSILPASGLALAILLSVAQIWLRDVHVLLEMLID